MESEATGAVNERYNQESEVFDASFGTEHDPAREVTRGTYSAHPEDPPIVPARSPAEQAELDARREEARRRELARLEADPDVRALREDLKDAPRDARGNVVPRNDGAYRDFEAVDARVRELEDQGYDHAHALSIVRDEIAAAREPEEEPERAHYTPGDRRYLGASVQSLIGKGARHPRVAAPKNASVLPDQTQLEQGAVSASGKVLREPCHACGYKNAGDAGVCQNCGAQFYREGRRGPAPSPTAKRDRVDARVSSTAKRGLESTGNASDVIECAGLAVLTGRLFEDVRRMTPDQREALRREAEALQPGRDMA